MSTLGPYDLLTQIGDLNVEPPGVPLHVKPGATVSFFMSCYQLGTLASPTTVAFVAIDPDDIQYPGTVQTSGTGAFFCDLPLPSTVTPGAWKARWTTGGQAYEGAISQTGFYVDVLGV